MLTPAQIEKLIAAARLASTALMNADPGDPKSDTGWANDESRAAWMALELALHDAEEN